MFDPLPYEFDGEVGLRDYGRMAYHVVYLPDAIAGALPPGPHRLEADIGGRSLEAGLQSAGDGRLYFILSGAFLARLGAKLGDPVSVAFRLGDPGTVDVPEPLAVALGEDPNATEVWDSLTPGVRRGFCHRVLSAKRPETRDRRVAEVLAALEGPAPSPYRRRS